MMKTTSKSMPISNATFQDHELTLMMRGSYAEALCRDPAATLDDLREAVTTLVDIERTARRVLGGAHPLTETIDSELEKTRAALRNRETPGGA